MRKILFLFCSILVLLATSCKNNPTSRQPLERYDNLKPLTLGAMSSMDYLPYVVAQKHGIYDSLGLELRIVKFFSANDRDAAFQSGNIDGTVIDYTGAALQQANGIPLSIVMKHDGYFHLIAGKESGITTTKQLRGKNIAVSRNTVIEYSTDQILTSAGLSPNEINKPEINKIPLRLEMLQNGQIDASVFPDPFATIAMSNGHKSVITTKDLGISVTGTIFNQKALTEKRTEIEALIRGYNEAVQYMREHPASEWADILTEDAGVPQALVGNIILPVYRTASLPSKKDIDYTINWLKGKNLIPQTYKGENLVDTIKGIEFGK